MVKHSNLSYGEGYPTRVRILTPNYLSFHDSDTLTSNYSVAHDPLASVSIVNATNQTANPADATVDVPGMYDFVFSKVSGTKEIDIFFYFF